MKDYNSKTRYGIRDDRIIDINDISPSERGLKCNCLCPACKSPLQARIGTGKRIKYFAHDNAECNPDTAYETTLHYMAKEILEKEKRIKLPKYWIFDDTDYDIDEYKFENPYDLYEDLSMPYEAFPDMMYNFDYVILEKRIDSIVPDIILVKGTRRLLVEIAVTHFIDDEKETKIKDLNLSTIEIDLSSKSDESLTYEELRQLIVFDTSYMRWVHNFNHDKYLKAVKERNQIIFDKAYDEMILYQERLRKLEKKRELKEKRDREITKKIEDMLSSDEYKKRVEWLSDDREANHYLRKKKFYSFCNAKIPYYINIPIRGEIAFDCDRRVWQGAIFDKFIYNRKTDGISLLKVSKWLFEHNEEFKINKLYSKKVEIKGQKVSLAYEAVKNYLGYLSKIGFIDCSGYMRYKRTYSIVAQTVIPPNEETSKKLKTIIDDIDEISSNIDSIIEGKLRGDKASEYSFYTHWDDIDRSNRLLNRLISSEYSLKDKSVNLQGTILSQKEIEEYEEEEKRLSKEQEDVKRIKEEKGYSEIQKEFDKDAEENYVV
jgi:competence CoiA-like predicted nuclease